MKKKVLLYGIALATSLNLIGQTKAERSLGSWYTYYGRHAISEKWSIGTGFEERNYQTFQNYNLTLYNIGVNYKLSKKITATLSYMYLDIDRTFDPDVVPNTIEHRYYEQISFASNSYKLPFSHRLRLEHRNLNSLGLRKLIHRIRYRFKSTVALSKKGYLTVSNESFFNFKGHSYAENRFYSAFGFKTTPNTAVEIGYLGHYINNLYLHRLQIGLFVKTGFRKKTKP